MTTIQIIGNWFVRSLPEVLIALLFVQAICNRKSSTRAYWTYSVLISFATGILPAFLPVTMGAFPLLANIVGVSLFSVKELGVKPQKSFLTALIPLGYMVIVCDLLAVAVLGVFGIGPELIQTKQTHIMALSSIGLLAAFIPITILNKKHAKASTISNTIELPSTKIDEDSSIESVWEE